MSENWRELPAGRELDRIIAEHSGYYAALVDVNEGIRVVSDDKAHGFAIFTPDDRMVRDSDWTWDLYDGDDVPSDDVMKERAWCAAFDSEHDEYATEIGEMDKRPPCWSTVSDNALMLWRGLGVHLEIIIYPDGSIGIIVPGMPSDDKTGELAYLLCRKWLAWREMQNDQ